MSQYIQTQKTQQVVDAWNKKYGIGEPVLVKKDDGEILHTKTRSKAQVMPSGQAVIWVVGITGCYDLARIAPVKQPVAVDPALGTGSFLNTVANPPYQTTFSVEDGTEGCKHSWGPTKSTNVGIYRVCSLCDKWDIEVV